MLAKRPQQQQPQQQQQQDGRGSPELFDVVVSAQPQLPPSTAPRMRAPRSPDGAAVRAAAAARSGNGGGGGGAGGRGLRHGASSGCSGRRRRRALLASLAIAAGVALALVLAARSRGGRGTRWGGGGGKAAGSWLPSAKSPSASRAAAKLTAALLAAAAEPAPPRPPVLYPGIELDTDERDDLATAAMGAGGGRDSDGDGDGDGADALPPTPLRVSPDAVARLRALTTGLGPDEPDDDSASSPSSPPWPPARAYSAFLSAAGAAAPPAARRKRAAAAAAAAAARPPRPVEPRDPAAASYLDPDGPLMDDMADQLVAVKAHLASPAFARAQAERRATGPARGIVLNAGGPRLLASAVVLLTVLREELNVTLPVELAWWGPGEMDGATLAALERRFPPLRGYDLSTSPYPSHHRPLRPSEARLVAAAVGSGDGGDGGGGSGGGGDNGGGSKNASTAAAAGPGGGNSGSKSSGISDNKKPGRRLSDAPAPEVLAGTPLEGQDPPSGGGQKPRAPAERGATRRRFAGKVFSLYATKFQRALLLDADCVPLSAQGLLDLFDDPAFLRRGTLFFPDFWASSSDEGGKGRAAELAGADAGAARAALSAGMAGLGGRDTESGALLVDLDRHADAVEVLWWLNSFPEHTYRAVWGDKDTYAAAFAGAGKASSWAQSGVPPGGIFAWRPRMLMGSGDGPRDRATRLDAWVLLGMLQFAPRTGLPLFMHRTIDKFGADDGGRQALAAAASAAADDAGAAASRDDLLRAGADHLPPHLVRRYAELHPWPAQLVTGPLPGRWVRYYLAQEPLGPTRGVPWDYVVPWWAVREWLPFPPAGSGARVVEGKGAAAAAAAAVEDAWQEEGEGAFDGGSDGRGNSSSSSSRRGGRLTCPVATFAAYRRARELGLPTGANATLDARCAWALRGLWGDARWRAFQALGLVERPELMWSAARDADAAAWSRPAPTMAARGAGMLRPEGGKRAAAAGGGRRRRRRALAGAPGGSVEERGRGADDPADDADAPDRRRRQLRSAGASLSREVGGALPVAALRWDYAAPRVDSPPLRAVRAAYAAQRDVAPGGKRRAEFPVLAGAGRR